VKSATRAHGGDDIVPTRTICGVAAEQTIPAAVRRAATFSQLIGNSSVAKAVI
jgi:hypothetical protein